MKKLIEEFAKNNEEFFLFFHFIGEDIGNYEKERLRIDVRPGAKIELDGDFLIFNNDTISTCINLKQVKYFDISACAADVL